MFDMNEKSQQRPQDNIYTERNQGLSFLLQQVWSDYVNTKLIQRIYQKLEGNESDFVRVIHPSV